MKLPLRRKGYEKFRRISKKKDRKKQFISKRITSLMEKKHLSFRLYRGKTSLNSRRRDFNRVEKSTEWKQRWYSAIRHFILTLSHSTTWLENERLSPSQFPSIRRGYYINFPLPSAELSFGEAGEMWKQSFSHHCVGWAALRFEISKNENFVDNSFAVSTENSGSSKHSYHTVYISRY